MLNKNALKCYMPILCFVTTCTCVLKGRWNTTGVYNVVNGYYWMQEIVMCIVHHLSGRMSVTKQSAVYRGLRV